ncbi:DUF3667 domain-containing protein [Mucilaginibacter polytrichastri]|uniref:DUF3667 domain-containing protein n=1 Tax=Mucilaginibacter polytrichastri TaxID=1302689 RepID=A0A1Q5ZW20_9SPHI|nr:DUF3667 domain-containing protein [Mucilaginibacter polytrichastri]OKS85972.1 hypothetical protein RG47T_1419 [Mucilaginibacter polytrichastri]SFS60112.1 Protein of unknown function [Mucilaginibacter polytrichastri]
MKKHYRHENDCLNCGTELEGKFCHHCGQENLQIKENFGHLMNHAVSDYFHFDHQFFHTLKPLLFQPGKLTNEYMAGRRVQYLHPIKMYIFISLIFFILIFKHGQEEKKEDIKKLSSTEKGAVLIKQLEANPNLTTSQKKKLEAIARNTPDFIKIDTKTIGSTPMINMTTTSDSLGKKTLKVNPVKSDTSIAKGNEAKLKNKHKKLDYDGDLEVDKDNDTFFSRLLNNAEDSTYADYAVSQQKLPAAERDGFFQRMAIRKVYAYKKYGSRAREVFMEELKHNVPKMMFVLLPLFALILRFAFWNNKKFYVEHLIFSFHLHCFLFLFLTITMLLKLLPDVMHLHGWVDFLGVAGITLYLYKAFRTVYHRSMFRTVSKMIGISFVYLMVFSFCMVGLVLITAATAV